MGEFFKGWRRKTGCITLVMACAFMGLDLRSRLVYDRFHNAVGENAHSYIIEYLDSYGGCIAWFHGNYEKRSKHLESLRIQKGQTNYPSIVRRSGILLKDDKIKWNWSGCGFGFGTIPPEPDDPPGSTLIWSVAYLSAVIPLTLFSIVLLLSKPRKSTQKKTDEPTANDGGGAS